MRLPDTWTGIIFAALGGFVILEAQNFMIPAGVASPRLFPRIIGGLLILFGLAIVLRALLGRRTNDGINLWPSKQRWMIEKKLLGRVIAVPAAIVIYGFAAPIFGSLLVSITLVFFTALLWGEKLLSAAILAIISCSLLTYFFTKVMLVPLPAGILWS